MRESRPLIQSVCLSTAQVNWAKLTYLHIQCCARSHFVIFLLSFSQTVAASPLWRQGTFSCHALYFIYFTPLRQTLRLHALLCHVAHAPLVVPRCTRCFSEPLSRMEPLLSTQKTTWQTTNFKLYLTALCYSIIIMMSSLVAYGQRGAQLLSLTFITSRVLDCSFCFVEKGKPRPPSRSQTQHSSQKDPGGEDEKADAERRVLEKKRRGGALENGDEVWLWSCY